MLPCCPQLLTKQIQMKKLFIVTFFFTSFSLLSFAQTGDTSARIKDFIKVWGFLKYHHPLAAAGDIDWDSVFVNNISGIMAAETPNQLTNIISAIIHSLGELPKTDLNPLPDSLFTKNKTDIDWMATSKIFDDRVKEQLRYIYSHKNQGTNKYIKVVHETADFSGEKKYDGIGFPNRQYRLLFLARFWNIINYFAPYKYLAANWDNVLEKLIPEIINSTDTLSYYTTLQHLSKSLNDGHSQLVLNRQMLSDLFFGSYTPPFYCEILDGKIVIRHVGNDSIGKALNIQQGDIVLKMDGEDAARMIAYKRKFISASNQADENHQLSRFILDGPSPNATLEIKRGKAVIKMAVKRISTQNRNWGAFINYTSNEVGYKKLDNSILLVYAMQIWNGNIDTIKKLIKQSNAVIFDVRNYPQNDAFFLIADPFLAEPKIIDYSTIALPQFPGLFKWKPNLNKIGHVSDSAYKGKVVILCDERTQSQGEYSCMVLQTIPGSVTIGSQTAGTDGIVTYVPMGNGLNISYSGYGVYYPDKTQTQQVGIKIDIPVKKTPMAIRDNKDEILERALQFIEKGK
jgi:carboxyl-terminal processing protease